MSYLMKKKTRKEDELRGKARDLTKLLRFHYNNTKLELIFEARRERGKWWEGGFWTEKVVG